MIDHIGIIGAGTMGAGIMIGAVMSGVTVTLIDRDIAACARAAKRLERYLARQAEKGRLAPNALPAIHARLHCATDFAALGGCKLVIEAVFENLELKRQIFAQIEANVSDTTILASNTSCLRLAEIATALRHRSRFCGMHYFSPAEINPVVELVSGPDTADTVIAAVQGFLRQTGKEVVSCSDQYGFALNRFFCPYTNEAVHLLDEGCATTAQIDEVAKETFGLALGPFAVMNIVGTATNLNAVRNLSALGPFYAVAKGLVAQGAENTPWDIAANPAPLDDTGRRQISDRLKLSVLVPVLEELAEGVADIEAIDRGAALAFRFGRTPGMLLADADLQSLEAALADFTAQRGHPQPALPSMRSPAAMCRPTEWPKEKGSSSQRRP